MSARPSGKTEPPWRRAEAGTYRSVDDRFEIEGGGPGRWYVRDSAERDELGLERTIGPFATLAAAKADAEARRGRAADTSPLERRLRDQRRHSGRRESSPAAPPPRPPTWLERLDQAHPEDAARARRWIQALERSGIVDAEAVVRRDIEADEPAIAEALLALALRQAVAAAVPAEPSRPPFDPGSADGVAIAEAARPVVREIVARASSAMLERVSEDERSRLGRTQLPGWRLVERDPEEPGRQRPIRFASDAVAGLADAIAEAVAVAVTEAVGQALRDPRSASAAPSARQRRR